MDADFRTEGRRSRFGRLLAVVGGVAVAVAVAWAMQAVVQTAERSGAPPGGDGAEAAQRAATAAAAERGRVCAPGVRDGRPVARQAAGRRAAAGRVAAHGATAEQARTGPAAVGRRAGTRAVGGESAGAGTAAGGTPDGGMHASGGRLADGGGALERAWPVEPVNGRGRPAVLRGWEPPSSPWGPGHRGVDLAARTGQEVRAAAPGRVAFAGQVAGRGVVTVELAGTGSPPLRTTYEPVRATVRPGDLVRAGDALGTVERGSASHCADRCVHWGLRRGDRYLDPLTLLPPRLRRAAPSRLLPVFGVPPVDGGVLAADRGGPTDPADVAAALALTATAAWSRGRLSPRASRERPDGTGEEGLPAPRRRTRRTGGRGPGRARAHAPTARGTERKRGARRRGAGRGPRRRPASSAPGG